MRKLSLSLESLQVESFATEAEGSAGRGTVRANADTSIRIACICDTGPHLCGGATLDISCAGTCANTCNATCGNTCGSTCDCVNTFRTCPGICGQTDGLHACIEPY